MSANPPRPSQADHEAELARLQSAVSEAEAAQVKAQRAVESARNANSDAKAKSDEVQERFSALKRDYDALKERRNTLQGGADRLSPEAEKAYATAKEQIKACKFSSPEAFEGHLRCVGSARPPPHPPHTHYTRALAQAPSRTH
jgi:chromosome segregation ATPase